MSRKKIRVRGKGARPEKLPAGQALSNKTSLAKLVHTLFSIAPTHKLQMTDVTEPEALAIMERNITDKEHKRILKLHRKAARAHSGQIGNHTAAYLAATDELYKTTVHTLAACYDREISDHIDKNRLDHEAQLLRDLKALVVSDYSENAAVFRRDMEIPESMSDEEMYVVIRDRLIEYLTDREIEQVYRMQREIKKLSVKHRAELKEILGAPTDKDAANIYTINVKKGEISAGVERALDLSTQSFLVLDRLLELAQARMTGKLFKFSKGYGVGRSGAQLIAGAIDGGNRTWSMEELPNGDE